MKTFRIKYTQASENMIEIEATSPKEAWKQITSGELDEKNVVLYIEGKVAYKAKVTEEITKHIASNPT